MKKLFRDKEDKLIFGVCAAIASSTGIDVSIIRLLWLIGTFATGSLLLWIYLLMAIVIPYKRSSDENS